MNDPSDFIVIDVPSMLAVKVTISEEAGERPDPNWNREAAESQYVFAEFLVEKGLLSGDLKVERRPDLTIRWSQLTDLGQQFVRNDFHKWLVSIDKSGTPEFKKIEKLERRWTKFTASQTSQ
ncbi:MULTISPECIES: hypothetical protein [unclassified Sphingopyxis]|uniref:hypothetical protein n=1 Tax=unclassified Sphingopyxis TaxID=2614943 RepID=UPI00285A5617|nr:MULTISPECIES: hypothetical protein [unclassified Sphingopyxis]MDR6831741.1 hypothetical protein [Sphingopyxis sp. BE122]MDR7227483.1 hypothetical protein [Sphingopyxis sp. BE259]